MASDFLYRRNVGIVWDRLPADVFEELALVYANQLRAMVRELLRLWGERILAAAIANAPWEDQSGQARAGLKTQIAGNIYGEYLVLYHTMDYGTYLEGWNPETNQPMLRGPEWAIIEPTLDEYGPAIMNDLRQKLRG